MTSSERGPNVGAALVLAGAARAGRTAVEAGRQDGGESPSSIRRWLDALYTRMKDMSSVSGANRGDAGGERIRDAATSAIRPSPPSSIAPPRSPATAIGGTPSAASALTTSARPRHPGPGTTEKRCGLATPRHCRHGLSDLTKVLDRCCRSSVTDTSAATSSEIQASRNRHPGPRLFLFCLDCLYISARD